MGGTAESEPGKPRIFARRAWFGRQINDAGGAARQRNDALLDLVLPERIELSISPLPRECSTTELRQRRAGSLMSRAPRTDTRRSFGWQGGVAQSGTRPQCQRWQRTNGRAAFAR